MVLCSLLGTSTDIAKPVYLNNGGKMEYRISKCMFGAAKLIIHLRAIVGAKLLFLKWAPFNFSSCEITVDMSVG